MNATLKWLGIGALSSSLSLCSVSDDPNVETVDAVTWTADESNFLSEPRPPLSVAEVGAFRGFLIQSVLDSALAIAPTGRIATASNTKCSGI